MGGPTACGTEEGKSGLKKSLWLTILILSLTIPGCSMAGDPHPKEKMVGGPCEYRNYPGQAEILAVSSAPSGTFDISFRFEPDEPVEEAHGRIALDRPHRLMPDGLNPPDGSVVDRFDIRPGKRFPCVMKVIKRGTCTPVLFTFPALASGGRR